MKFITQNKIFSKAKEFFKFVRTLLKFLTQGQRLVAYLCMFLLITFIFNVIFGDSGIIKYFSVHAQNVRYERLIKEQQEINFQLKNDLSLLRSNSPDIVDEILRQKFNMGGKGIYILKED